jgi:putative toxin-antitoxin system antitoxin component (TIGR02293 family)
MADSAVARKLGGKNAIGRSLKTDADLIDAVRRGLPAKTLDSVFSELAQERVPQSTVYRLIGSDRTLQRKRTNNKPLSALESDRLARLARILVRAEQAIGDASRGRKWLVQRNRALGGQRPLDLLDSDTGTLAVERTLGRIEYGIYD